MDESNHAGTALGHTGSTPSCAEAERLHLDGATVRRMFEHAATWLEQHVGAVNALNVFPVPDGDTGTNMHLTMRAAVEAARRVADESAGAVIRAAANGAVLGARGNSGVILSQIVAGLAKGFGDAATVTPDDLAKALAEGSRSAYHAVTRPVEGTILSVARAAGEAATAAVDHARGSLQNVMTAALEAARIAVRETPVQLPILRQAGVVDAGGEGYRLILEGMAFAIRGEILPRIASVLTAPTEAPGLSVDRAPFVDGEDPLAGEWGYCTQFLVVSPDGGAISLADVRDSMHEVSVTTIVVGGEGFVRVHGHTEDPGAFLTRGVKFGRVHRIMIEDMDAQAERWRADVSGVVSAAPVDPGATLVDLAFLAVAPGDGFARVFRDLGVAAVVAGGQTMNPSAEEILDGARMANARVTIVLPNNGNVVMTARQAGAVSAQQLGAGREIIVVPSRTVAQGIAAMVVAGLYAEGEPAATAAAMEAALSTVRTVEVTRATRDVELDGVRVRTGDLLGLVDDKVVTAGTDIQTVAIGAVDAAGGASAELLTVYRGADVSEADGDAFGAHISATYPRALVEVVVGGQPHYDFVISVE
jgi:DAK2 domain fusion protein YloV